MRRAWCLAVVVALVCLCAASALAAESERLINLEFYGLDFHHLIDLFQKEAPDLVFVAAPGVGDMSLTIKTPRPLPVDGAIEAAAGALDLEVHRAGNVVVFRPRFGPVPEKRPRGEAQVSALPPVKPWPEKFVGADMLVDLQVKDRPLDEVAKLLGEQASTKGLKWSFQVTLVGLEPVPPDRIKVTASFYRRPLAEVLGYLTNRLGLTYAVDQGYEKSVIYITPRPNVVTNARYVVRERGAGWQEVEESRPGPRPQAE